MFRKSTSMISAWELNGNEKFAEIQRSILKEAVKMLKPGGMILYSTCTFDPREDEEQVRYLLALDESLEVKPIKMYEGFEKGHSDWLDMFNGAADDISDSQDSLNLSYTAHLFPHRVKGEGHFVSLIGKHI